MLEKLEKDFNLHKEVIGSLPINNEKNKKHYIEEVQKIIDSYETTKDQIYQELQNRLNPYFEVPATDYSNEEKSIDSFAKALMYTSNLNTPYEKLKLDKIVFLLSGFASEDFNQINSKISSAINIFELSGINITSDDFNYTRFVNEYMYMFFKYRSDMQNENLKKSFENIYWKCPNIIMQLEFNLRFLYFKNEDKLKKYIQKNSKIMLSQFKDGEKNLIDDYAYLREKLENEKLNDKNNLIHEFVSGNLLIDNYSDDKVNTILDNLTLEKREDLITIIKKLKNTLEEYQNYLKYSKLIDTIKTLYNETLEKSFLEIRFKKIRKLEKKLFKLNKKTISSNKKTKVNKFELEAENIINEIKTIYDEIDENMFKVIIKQNLKDNSTIFKALLLSCQYYSLLAKHFDQTDEESLNKQINDLYYFTLNPNNNLINNTTILEEKDLATVIVNNYRIFGINLTKDMLEENNLKTLIDNLKTVIINYQLKTLNISSETLKNIESFKKIQEKTI